MENSRPRLRFVKTDNPPVWVRPLIPVLALVVTFILTSGLIIWAKANPFEAYYQLLISPLMSKVNAIEVLVSATPLLLTGAAVTFSFAAGYYNIGAEGQLFAGAIAAAGLGVVMKDVPAIITIPSIIIAGFAAGMAWALVPALLKVKMQVDEVVTTLLLNSVMGFHRQRPVERPVARSQFRLAAEPRNWRHRHFVQVDSTITTQFWVPDRVNRYCRFVVCS